MSVRLIYCVQLLLVHSLLGSAQEMECLASNGDVEQAFTSAGIVPNLVSESPDVLLNVTYNGNVEVCLGEEINPSVATRAPDVIYRPPIGFYTLALIDPDAEPVSPFLHYLVLNIRGSANANTGTMAASYVPPTPPPGSGTHRYTFLVYEQSNKIEEGLINNILMQTLERAGFDIENFAAENNLGEPLAGNYFTAKATN